ncbi:MAG: hypothetical protein KatS3mg002_0315 [Candidatus Woesearchaeota archaeon]|nr:MAG: hypothetical protein KatS3mg002_0315 [Candidatus Woesearchaeota archaeon]
MAEKCELHQILENDIEKLQNDIDVLKEIHNDLKWIKVISRFLIGTLISLIFVISPGVFSILNKMNDIQSEVAKQNLKVEIIDHNLKDVKDDLNKVKERVDGIQRQVNELQVTLEKHNKN